MHRCTFKPDISLESATVEEEMSTGSLMIRSSCSVIVTIRSAVIFRDVILTQTKVNHEGGVYIYSTKIYG